MIIKKCKDAEVEVDNRWEAKDIEAWKIADILLDNRLNRMIDNIYNGVYESAKHSASSINEAFRKADKILDVVYGEG